MAKILIKNEKGCTNLGHIWPEIQTAFDRLIYEKIVYWLLLKAFNFSVRFGTTSKASPTIP